MKHFVWKMDLRTIHSASKWTYKPYTQPQKLKIERRREIVWRKQSRKLERDRGHWKQVHVAGIQVYMSLKS